MSPTPSVQGFVTPGPLRCTWSQLLVRYVTWWSGPGGLEADQMASFSALTLLVVSSDL